MSLTPSRSPPRRLSPTSTPPLPAGYTVEPEATPTTFHIDASRLSTSSLTSQDQPSGSSSNSFPNSSGSGSTSFADDSMLEILDDDEDEEDFGFEEDEDRDGNGDGEGTDGEGSGQPLVDRGRKRRRRWDTEPKVKERSLIELIPPLILAHPLPLLPLLALLPYSFLPAGVVLFVPLICVLALLSSCAHIVIVYLAWYLKVNSFEEVFACVAGRYGRWAGRAIVVSSVMGLVIGWLGTLHPLIAPAVKTYLPENDFYSNRILWTILGSITLLPSLLPSRITRPLRKSPIILALFLPVIAFLVIGRTVEIKKAADLIKDDVEVQVRRTVGNVIKRGLGSGGSAGAGLTTLTLFLTPHLNTLPIHSSLNRNSRSQFPIPCLSTSLLILIFALPLSLVPYYLLPLPQTTLAFDPTSILPTPAPSTPSSTLLTGVFSLLPSNDGWVNFARFLTCAITLGTCNMWILRGRDTMLKVLGVEAGDGRRVARWVGVGMWFVCVGFTCIGGKVVEKIELIGVFCAIAVGWFLPSLFFIITFHVRSPLAIVFPYGPPPPPPPQTPARSLRSNHSHNRTDSLNDPSTDHLLARKERQLQKRRAGRRLWQDLIVYLGILPVGLGCLVWTVGSLVGVW